MASIYIHIPFCKQACHYCNFHFSTNRKIQQVMVAAIQTELGLQKGYLQGAMVTTLYFGGGTPSLLSSTDIAGLLEDVKNIFPYQEGMEVTLEANPDDITLEQCQAWRSLGINRLSIGIQSFQPALLSYLNRAHDAKQALACLEMVQQGGFNTVNLDLIYAIPGQTDAMFQQDLQIALTYRPTHLSVYCLTIEPRTVFGDRLAKGKMYPVPDERAIQQFFFLVDFLTQKGYEHYEISNFSLPNHYSKHNTNYWKKGHYLGVGPGAHSYNGISRQYNVAHNHRYLESLKGGKIPATIETLQRHDHVNEYIMTSLRTQWGCSMDFLRKQYGYSLTPRQHNYLELLVAKGYANIVGDIVFLTTGGKLLADQIAADLFVDK